MKQSELLDYLKNEGYTLLKVFEDGNISGILNLIYTCAIVSGLTKTGYENRWCYHDEISAIVALTNWDGEDGTEPDGWHRHPQSGRRRENGDASKEYVNH